MVIISPYIRETKTVQWEGVCEFVAVVECQSLTAAGRRLGISTAQVSRQLSALEARLAVRLINRTTRKVVLTEAGQLYYQQCRPVLDGLEAAERLVTNLQQRPRGRLLMTAPVTYGERTIAPLVNDFIARYPELEVRLELTNQTLDLVQQGYDLAIRLGRLTDSTMMARRLASRRLFLCASPAYLARHGAPHSLGELEQHNCLLGTLDYWRFDEAGQARNVRVHGNLRCNSGLVLVDAALKGQGLVQLPDYYVQGLLHGGELVALLPQYQPAEEGVWALYPHNRHLSPKVRMLLDQLAAGLDEAKGR